MTKWKGLHPIEWALLGVWLLAMLFAGASAPPWEEASLYDLSREQKVRAAEDVRALDSGVVFASEEFSK